jgi:hypothetical protein
MYEVKSNDLFNQIFEYYRQKRQDEDGERPWLDANFYLQMDLWVAEEFNCTGYYMKDPGAEFTGVHIFEFKNQEDYVRLRMTI